MLTTRYITNYIGDNIDEIKIAALYFDKIEIVKHTRYDVGNVIQDKKNKNLWYGKIKKVVNYITDEFQSHISLLKDEGVIVEVYEEQGNFYHDLFSKSLDFINSSSAIFYETFKIIEHTENEVNVNIKFNPEVHDVYTKIRGPLEEGVTIYFGFIEEYYADLLTSLLNSMSSGNLTLTTSPILHKFMMNFYKNENLPEKYKKNTKEKICAQLGIESLKFVVPDVSNLSMEDILDLRFRLKDELIRFREEVEIIQDDLIKNYDKEYIKQNIDKIIKRKINPSVEDLSRKLNFLSGESAIKLIRETLAKPLVYTTIISHFIDNLPLYISILLKVGLDVTLERSELKLKKEELSKNGLYYLISLRDQLS